MVKLEGTEKIILQELKKAKMGYTRREICEVTNYTRNTVSKHLENLKEKELVVEEQRGGIYLYHANENLPEDYEVEQDASK